MSGPKRNPDRLNTIGVVVVGICGAVLVYVTIVALQAFYMDDTSEIQTMADYGGQDTQAKNIRAQQMGSLTMPSQPNARGEGMPQTYRIPMKQAMKLVLDDAKKDPGNLVPVHGRSDKATVQPIFGRPRMLQPAAPTDGAGAGSAAGSGQPATPATDAGSAAAPTGGQGGGNRSGATEAPNSGAGPAPVRLPENAGSGSAAGSAAKGNGR